MVMAHIYVLVGEYDQALDTMESVLAMPGGYSARLLAIDPIWAPLQGNPRFQKLLQQPDRVF
jgi:hypothetical protein